MSHVPYQLPPSYLVFPSPLPYSPAPLSVLATPVLVEVMALSTGRVGNRLTLTVLELAIGAVAAAAGVAEGAAYFGHAGEGRVKGGGGYVGRGGVGWGFGGVGVTLT